MSAVYRGVIVIFVALLLVVIVAVTAHAQSWSSTFTSGLTSVYSSFTNGSYTWTLRNLTSLPDDRDAASDVLVWELIPYQVREPLAWAAPSGWTWAGDRWTRTSGPTRKYFTPDALGPGESVQFAYTPNPDGALINASGAQPDGLAFVAHVGAVVPGSGSHDGSRAWTPVNAEYGPSWFDKSFTTAAAEGTVAEPRSIATFVLCLIGTVGTFRLQLRRSRA